MNLPNILSTLRLIAVPCFVWLFFAPFEGHRLWAAVLFAAAGITDVLDGYIARKHNIVTRLGRFLDPLGDKLLQFSAILCLTISRALPLWIILVFTAKELAMLLGGLLLYKNTDDIMPSNMLGKTASFCFFALLFFSVMLEGLDPALLLALFSAALLLTVFAMTVYYLSYRGLFKKR